MNLSKKQWIRLGAAGGATMLLVLFLLLMPGKESGDILEKYNALFERKEYVACVSGLKKELAKKPDWQEARELLIRASLMANTLEEALDSHLYLLKAGEKDVFGGQILSALSRSPEQQVACISAVRAFLESNPHSPEVWMLLTRFEMDLEHGNPAAVLEIISTMQGHGLTTTPVVNYLRLNIAKCTPTEQEAIFMALETQLAAQLTEASYNLYILLAERLADYTRQSKALDLAARPDASPAIKSRGLTAWSNLLELAEPDPFLFEFALLLGPDRQWEAIQRLNSGDETFRKLQRQLPKNPLIQLTGALYQHNPELPLARLNVLRQHYDLLEQFPAREYISATIRNILLHDINPAQIQVLDLNFLDDYQVYSLYTLFRSQIDKAVEITARQRLAENPQYAMALRLLASIDQQSQAYEPKWSFSAPVHGSYLSVSPSSQWAVIYNGFSDDPDADGKARFVLVNLNTLEQTPVEAVPIKDSLFTWNLSGTLLTLPDNSILNPLTGERTALTLPASTGIIGWYDDSHLLIGRDRWSWRPTFLSFNYQTSQQQELFTGEAKIVYGNNGQIAWVESVPGNVKVQIGSNSYFLPPNYHVLSFDDQGLYGHLFNWDDFGDSRLCYLSFATKEVREIPAGGITILSFWEHHYYSPAGFAQFLFDADGQRFFGVITPDLEPRLLGNVTGDYQLVSGNYLCDVSQNRIDIYEIKP